VSIRVHGPGIKFNGRPLSAASVSREIALLWAGEPGLHSYGVQDVEYTRASLGRVTRACTAAGGGGSIGAQQVLACAPLVYFFYSYGTAYAAPKAVAVADRIYSFAVQRSETSSPPAAALEAILRGWGVPVTNGGPVGRAATTSPAVTALVHNAGEAMIRSGSVRVVMTGYLGSAGRPVERIRSQVGTTSASESITERGASATIRILPQAAFVSGNLDGLLDLIGLPRRVATRAHGRWIEVDKGTSQYTDLATEETIAALPASILPLGITPVKLGHEIVAGARADVLRWQAASTSGNPHTRLTESLVLAPGAADLPQTETTETGQQTQRAEFSDWGRAVEVAPPPAQSVIDYRVIASGGRGRPAQ
jgi:hypothetical protein